MSKLGEGTPPSPPIEIYNIIDWLDYPFLKVIGEVALHCNNNMRCVGSIITHGLWLWRSTMSTRRRQNNTTTLGKTQGRHIL